LIKNILMSFPPQWGGFIACGEILRKYAKGRIGVIHFNLHITITIYNYYISSTPGVGACLLAHLSE
jgi:hypothetical protein